jgi:PAS domain S-box-containing protein
LYFFIFPVLIFPKTSEGNIVLENKVILEYFYASSIPMWIIDAASFNFLELNEAAISILGYSKSEFQVLSVNDIQFKDSPTSFAAFIIESKGNKGKRLESLFKTKEGQILKIKFSTFKFSYQQTNAILITVESHLITDNNNSGNEGLYFDDIKPLFKNPISRSENLFKLREKWFKLFTEHSTELISLYDENFKFIYRSNNAYDFSGRYDDDTTESVLQYLHPDDLIRFQPALKTLLETKGHKIHDRIRWRHADGHYLWLEGTITNLLHDENVKAIVSNMRDITREMKLRENQGLLASIVSSSNDAIISCNLEGKITSWNKSSEKLLGYTAKEAIGADFKMFIPTELILLEEKLMNETIKGSYNQQTESQRITNNGSLIDVLLTISAIKNDNDEVIGISKIIHDRTESKQKQEELELFKSLVENSNDAVIVTEAEPYNEPGPRILYVNKAFTKTTGYTKEEVLGKTPRILQGPLTKRKELDKTRTALEKWEPSEIEVINYKKNGDPFWVNISTAPIANEKGWYTNWVSIQKDVTLRRKELEEKEMMIKELTSNNKELKQFSYIISHNLRAPLTNLMGIMPLLNVVDQRSDALLDAFKSSTNSLKTTLDDLINIMIIKEKTNIELVSVNFETHLKKVISSINKTIDNAEAEISFDFSAAQSVLFNAAYLESVFLNLITNSIKFSRPESNPCIRITSYIQDNCVQLYFADNGLGMNWTKVKGKIFGLYQKFHRHDESKGIGLYLIHSQITALGGKIEVETALNKGTTFIVTFPPELF